MYIKLTKKLTKLNSNLIRNLLRTNLNLSNKREFKRVMDSGVDNKEIVETAAVKSEKIVENDEAQLKDVAKQTSSNGSNSKPEALNLITEIRGDLFQETTISLAHCVSADMVMGKGIAVIFKNTFKNVDKLKEQNEKVGGCAYLFMENRYIFYLVTKEKYNYKPTYTTLKSSLIKMKDIILEKKVNELAMPKIGCGLDNLNWPRVKNIIQDVFKDTQVKIKIYELEAPKEAPKAASNYAKKPSVKRTFDSRPKN